MIKLLFIFGSLIALFLMHSVIASCQSIGLAISLNSPQKLNCDHSSPAIVSIGFSSNTTLNTANIQISVQKNTTNGEFEEYIDSFGDKLYNTVFTTESGQLIAKIGLSAGNYTQGLFSLKLIIVLLNSSHLQLSANTSIFLITRSDSGDYQISLMLELEIDDSQGGERRKTYTYDDLKTMTPGQLVTFLIMVVITNYGWLLIFLIFVVLYGRYRSYRRYI